MVEDSTWYIMDIVISADHHVKEKEEEKIYMYMAAELRRQLRVEIVIVRTNFGALMIAPSQLPECPKNWK